MAKAINVEVRRAFTFRGAQLAPGARVLMSTLEAAVWSRRGCVSLTRKPATAPVEVVDVETLAETPAEPDAKRRYKRRDLRAEG